MVSLYSETPVHSGCKLTHGLILMGRCPWCDQPVRDGRLRPDLAATATESRQWDTPAMLRALDHQDVDVRLCVVDDLLCFGTRTEEALSVREALPVLRKALADCEEQVHFLAANALTRLGSKLGAQDVQEFEQQAQHQATDLALRLLLLGYYYLPATMYEHCRAARHRHIFWVIEHSPERVTLAVDIDLDPATDGEAYAKAKQLWLKQVEVNEANVTILGNAARFFFHSDRGLSEAILKKAQAIEPGNPKWSQRLGDLYAHRLHQVTGQARRDTAAKALSELERAFHLETDEFRRFLALPDLAKAAVAADEREKARIYATELIEKTKDPGYSMDEDGPGIHYGNLVLGRLALLADDVEKAKYHLLESGRTTGSPVLCTGGPNMSLAKELLERGEREGVVAFLRLCSNFWQSNDHRAEQWAYAIEHGETPDFGPNLDY
jgi:hypothetical protein